MNYDDLYNKATECIANFNIAEAVGIYSKIISYDKNNYCAYMFRAYLNTGVDKFEVAIQDFSKAITNRELNDEKEIFQLIESFKYAINVNTREITNVFTFFDADDYAYRGNCYYQLKEYNKAIRDFKESIRKTGRSLSVLNQLGLCYYELRLFDDSISVYNEALELDSKATLIYFNKALSYYYMNQYVDSFENFVMAEEQEDFEKWPIYQKMTLLSILTEIEAPFFTHRLIEKINISDNFTRNKYLISDNINNYIEIISTLNYIEKEKLVEQSEFLILKGILTYYFNDPRICYNIFNEIINNKSDLMTEFYYVLSNENYLAGNYESALENAIKKVNRLLIINENLTQLYYAGQLLVLHEDYSEALKYFSICIDYIPALCMQIVCYDYLDNIKKRDNLINELLFFDKHNKGLIQYSELPKLTISKFKESIELYTKLREIQVVIPILNEYCEIYDSNMIPAIESINKNVLNTFSFNENGDDAKIINNEVLFYKKEILSKFCTEAEQIFSIEFKDHFILWNNILDKKILQQNIGSLIPILFEKGIDFKIIVDLFDYYYINNKIELDQRILLVYWAKLNEVKNKKNSKANGTTIKIGLELLVEIVLTLFGIKNILPDFLMFFGTKSSSEIVCNFLLKNIANSNFKNNMEIPNSYFDFEKQVEFYWKKTLNE